MSPPVLLLILGLTVSAVPVALPDQWSKQLLLSYIHPTTSFAAQQEDPAPDYDQPRYWAALPGHSSGAMLSPDATAVPPSQAPADVFYIHPTSYISGERWNAPLFAPTRAWEMVDIILGAQASAFNACCNIYAPHYRQAALSAFLEMDGDDAPAALDLAYSDVLRAFDAFLSEQQDRPFIIAGHSQGSYHALRLLHDRVDGTPLQNRLVAAYLIGYWIPLDTFERVLPNIPPCDAAADTGCVLHWSTYADNSERRKGIYHWYPEGIELADGKPLLCNNPLNWERDGARVPAREHPGALYVSRGGSKLNTLFNRPANVTLDGLPPLRDALTWAECRDGLLYVASQKDTVFREVGADPSGDYHLIDYSLFYQSIKQNALARTQRFVEPVLAHNSGPASHASD